jgi:hypothetical protein
MALPIPREVPVIRTIFLDTGAFYLARKRWVIKSANGVETEPVVRALELICNMFMLARHLLFLKNQYDRTYAAHSHAGHGGHASNGGPSYWA